MFWDFVTSRPETTLQVLVIFSDLGTPDGYRYMNGFGSNTFKMVNATGNAVYVKFHYLVSSTLSLFPRFFLLKSILYTCTYHQSQLRVCVFPEPFDPNAGILTPIKSRFLSLPSPVLCFLNIQFYAIWTEKTAANLSKLGATKTAEVNANFECLQDSTHFHYPLKFQKSDCPQRSKIFPIKKLLSPARYGYISNNLGPLYKLLLIIYSPICFLIAPNVVLSRYAMRNLL
jgi:hypothetical protein